MPKNNMVVRLKVDDKVGALIGGALDSFERCFFVLIGRRTRDQVLNLYNIREKFGHATSRGRPTVCWCFKKSLDFTANKMKKLAQLRKKKRLRGYDADVEDAFWLFQQGTKVTYCRYKDSQRLLGTTCDVLVLQDFEAITPNILCRALETVRGGGMIILLFKELETFKDLFHQRMDLYGKKYADAVEELKPRYCERFIKSLTQCRNCLVLNDRLEVLPISQARLDEIVVDKRAGVPLIKSEQLGGDLRNTTRIDTALVNLRSEFAKDKWIAPILELCLTFDQAKVVANISTRLGSQDKIDANHVTAILASRGRGKSAALGLGLAIGVRVNSFTTIGVCAIAIENVSTIFEFLCRGLEALGTRNALVGDIGYHKILYGDKVADKTSPTDVDDRVRNSQKSRELLIAEVRYQAPEGHTTRIEYVDLRTALARREEFQLLIIDEAASIPVPVIRKIVSSESTPVLLASTVDGYEGSGLSLTQLVLKQLSTERAVEKQIMNAPIRYAKHDPIEAWLRNLLCLNAGAKV